MTLSEHPRMCNTFTFSTSEELLLLLSDIFNSLLAVPFDGTLTFTASMVQIRPLPFNFKWSALYVRARIHYAHNYNGDREKFKLIIFIIIEPKLTSLSINRNTELVLLYYANVQC